jgi:hypothetical protein
MDGISPLFCLVIRVPIIVENVEIQLVNILLISLPNLSPVDLVLIDDSAYFKKVDVWAFYDKREIVILYNDILVSANELFIVSWSLNGKCGNKGTSRLF